MRIRKQIVACYIIGAVLIASLGGCNAVGGRDTASSSEVSEMTDDVTDTEAEDTLDRNNDLQKPTEVVDPELSTEESAIAEVILGDEQFEEYLPLLTDKRVAVFSNQSGIVGDEILQNEAEDAFLCPFGQDEEGNSVIYGTHIVDALIERGVAVTAIFSPEHGFRGTADAGAVVGDSVDEKTGVPILSLYASTNTHYPSADSMAQFDVLVIDMQDVGLRYYTYYISMYYLMDACAQYGKAVIILDRPNPNGFYVDGPILQDEYHSGVGQLPIPVVHGMTWGELARMINGEGWLTAGKDACDLTVIPCKNYTHQIMTALIVNPSPNLKDMQAVYLYSSTCFFENTIVSVGRGTEYPFTIYGSPYLQGVAGNEYSFVPQSMAGATNPQYEGQTCYGRSLRDIPTDEIRNNQIDLSYLITAYQDMKEYDPNIGFFGTPDGQGRYWIDLLFGTDEVRYMIENGSSAEEIEASWQEDVKAFKEQRRPYLLYEE